MLNEAKEIKTKPIVFIYALRDELFESTDARTKFFDFIIPIIPIVNPSNSKDILLEKLKEYQIDKALISFVSTYLKDMRILHNIINEFVIYTRKLIEFELNPTKLFSMIVYKNLHPKDFSDLHFNKGIVYDAFQVKDELQHNLIIELDGEISSKKDAITLIEDEFTASIKALRFQYLGALISLTSHLRPSHIYLESKNISFKELTSDQNFKLLQSTKNITSQNNQNGRRNTDLTFKNLENEVGDSKTYKEREKAITDKLNNTQDYLKDEIEGLEIQKRELISLPLSELASHSLKNKHLPAQLKKSPLIRHLLLECYIDENYHDYISYFYPGSLTRNDEEFRRSVYEGNSKEFDFKLTNCAEIIDSFTLRHFGHSSVLNFHLVNYLLESPRKDDQELTSIIQNLSSQDAVSKDFIVQYFENDSNQHGIFIKSLCFHWPEFWKFVLDEITPFDRQVKYLDLILSNCDNDSLDDINSSTGYLLNYAIGNMNHFIEYYENSNHLEKIKSVIKHLNVQFKELDIPANESQLLAFIYENSLYELNSHMIQLIIERVGKKSFVENHIYTSVQESDLKSLTEKVENDLYEFVKHNIIIQSSIDEQEIYFLSLLNSELKPDIKEELIQIQTDPISDISEVPTNLWNTLLLKLKVKPSWDNIGHYYSLSEEGKLSQELVDFINNQDVANELSKLDFKFDSLDSLASRNLEKELLLSESMETYSYGKIIPTTITSSDDLLFTDLQKEKVCILLENHVLAFSISHYDQLQSSYSPLHMRLIAQNQQSFTRSFEELHFTGSDLRYLLIQEDISLETKTFVVKETDFSTVSITGNLANLLFPFLVEQDIRFEKTIELSLFEFAGSLENQLSFFNMIIDSLTKSEITDLLLQLPEQYAKMAMKGKKTYLPSQRLIFEILGKLLRKGYVSSTREVGEKIKVNSKKGDWLR